MIVVFYGDDDDDVDVAVVHAAMTAYGVGGGCQNAGSYTTTD